MRSERYWDWVFFSGCGRFKWKLSTSSYTALNNLLYVYSWSVFQWAFPPFPPLRRFGAILVGLRTHDLTGGWWESCISAHVDPGTGVGYIRYYIRCRLRMRRAAKVYQLNQSFTLLSTFSLYYLFRWASLGFVSFLVSKRLLTFNSLLVGFGGMTHACLRYSLSLSLFYYLVHRICILYEQVSMYHVV